MNKLNSLSFKVPIIIISIIFVTVVSLTTVSALSSLKTTEDSVLSGFKATVSGYAYMIDMILHEQLLATSTYAKIDTIIDAAMNPDNEEYKNKAIALLKTLSSINDYNINIGIADMNGVIIADNSNPQLHGTSIKTEHQELFNTLMQKNYAFTFDNNVTKVSTGAAAVLLCGGIKDQTGNNVGILYLTLDLSKVNKTFIADLDVAGRIAVGNDKLDVILSSDNALLGTKLPSVYNVITTTKIGTLKSYTFDGDTQRRTAAYQNIKIMPWTIIFDQSNKQIYGEVYQMLFRSILVGVIFMVVCALIIFFYIKTITTPLEELVMVASEVSEGNLSSRGRNINRSDELGLLATSVYDMRDNLTEIIAKVRSATEEINFNARELAQGTSDLANRTESQAASLEETASSMEEMASTIKSSTEQSVEGNRMMIESKSSIQNAGEIILETTKNIEEVYEASSKIKDITKIIEDIAFQTNILALNAAVEAARAGDQGKGFAVVASEVRNLAQTTQSSVKDITDLVDNTNNKINKATDSARTSQDIFSELQTKMDDTARIMQDITSTAVEQQAGVDQINRAVTEMDSATQQNAALVEEASASSTSLMNQVEALVRTMDFFKV